MTEAKPTEQAANESKSVADMTSDEVRAEIARLDQELAQEPPPSEAAQGKGAKFTGASANPATLAREVQAVRRNLIRQYESLNDDEKYTDEYRASRAWEAYDEAKPKIEQQAAAAREALLKDAERLELASIPFPGGQSLRTDDMQQLSLVQGERQRIAEKLSYEHPSVARLKAQGKNAPSFEASALDKLRDEYSRGLKESGVRGASVCAAVLQIAEDRGMNVDDIVDEHRRDWQRTHLQNAQQARIQAQSVYSRVPLPSSPRPGGPRTIGEAGAGKRRSALGLKKSSGPTFPKRKRRPNWK